VNLFNRDSAVDNSFADRTALVILLAAFGVSDAAAVGWSAGAVSGAEVFAGAFSFALIAFGAIFTAYKMARAHSGSGSRPATSLQSTRRSLRHARM
jgi:hypothetical protein